MIFVPEEIARASIKKLLEDIRKREEEKYNEKLRRYGMEDRIKQSGETDGV